MPSDVLPETLVIGGGIGGLSAALCLALRGGAVTLVERSKSGEESIWAEVLAWEPPTRIAFTWHPGYPEGDPVTEVEVRFRAQDGCTIVELEHMGWERLGERAEETRANYADGWEDVLGQFEQAL